MNLFSSGGERVPGRASQFRDSLALMAWRQYVSRDLRRDSPSLRRHSLRGISLLMVVEDYARETESSVSRGSIRQQSEGY
jgi:hypothetical protein